MKELDEIEARAMAATDGPWKCHLDISDPETRVIEAVFMDERISFVGRIGTDYEKPSGPYDPMWKDALESQEIKNAAFITNARIDVPRLVAALREVLRQHAALPREIGVVPFSVDDDRIAAILRGERGA